MDHLWTETSGEAVGGGGGWAWLSNSEQCNEHCPGNWQMSVGGWQEVDRQGLTWVFG